MQGLPGLERTAPSSCGHAGCCRHDAVHRAEMGRARCRPRQPRGQFYPQWREAVRRAIWKERIAPGAIVVMAGHSRPKDGVASARLCPGHPRLYVPPSEDVDARQRRQVDAVCARQTTMAGHDEHELWTLSDATNLVPN